MTITLSGEPKSTQTIYRSACRGRFPTTYMTREGKGIKDGYRWQAMEQWGRQSTLKGDVAVSIKFFFATKRMLLTGIAYVDDSQISTLSLSRAYDAESPRIEVTILPATI